MSGKQQGGGGGGGGMSDEMTALAFVVVSAMVIWLIWNKARNLIVWTAFGLNWVQFKAMDMLGLLGRNGKIVLDDMQGYLDGRYDPFDVTWKYLTDIEKLVGGATKWFMIGAIVVMAVVTIFKMKGEGFRRQYTLTGKTQDDVFRFFGVRINNIWVKRLILLVLIVFFVKRLFEKKGWLTNKKEWVTRGMSFAHFQASHWKVMLAGAHFDPNVDDDTQRPQKTPLEWMRDCGIRLNRREGLDEDAAEKAFQNQLGPNWQGLEKAPVYIQALCILSALNVKRDRAVNKLRDSLTEAYVLNRAKADEVVKGLIAPYLKDKKIVDAINRHGAKHAFQNTAMIGIYGWGGPMKEWGGGEAGVLSSSMFRWLKPIDRTLWYALNNVGRRAFHIEGAGVVNHFFAERVVGGPLAEAHVDEAMDGLTTYIEEQGIMDLDEFFAVKKDF